MLTVEGEGGGRQAWCVKIAPSYRRSFGVGRPAQAGGDEGGSRGFSGELLAQFLDEGHVACFYTSEIKICPQAWFMW